jgi:hypothetical protein
LISFYFSKLAGINRQLVTAMVSLVYVELGLDKIFTSEGRTSAAEAAFLA